MNAARRGEVGLVERGARGGPRLLKLATSSKASVAPTANDSAYAPGLRRLPALGPALPAANAGKISAARQASMSGTNSLWQPAAMKAQELFTTSGALFGSPPGARNPRNAVEADARPTPLSAHALAAMLRRATLMALPPALPPTAVAVAWVLCPFSRSAESAAADRTS
jgi:hypothetical protein